jgi:hypothetical protein
MQKKMRLLPRQVLTAHEDERRLISRELHDEVIQPLAGISVELAGLGGAGSLNPPQRQQRIVRTPRHMEESIRAVHPFARERMHRGFGLPRPDCGSPDVFGTAVGAQLPRGGGASMGGGRSDQQSVRRNPGHQGQDLEKHRQPLMNKLDIHQTAGLTCYARVGGMIESRGRVTIL